MSSFDLRIWTNVNTAIVYQQSNAVLANSLELKRHTFYLTIPKGKSKPHVFESSLIQSVRESEACIQHNYSSFHFCLIPSWFKFHPDIPICMESLYTPFLELRNEFRSFFYCSAGYQINEMSMLSSGEKLLEI